MDDPKLKAKGKALVQVLRLRRLPRNLRPRRRRPHRHRTNQRRQQAHRASGLRAAHRRRQARRPARRQEVAARLVVRPQGLLRTQAGQSGRLRHRQVQAESARSPAHAQAQRQRSDDINALDDHAARQHRSVAAARLHVQARRRTRLRPKGLVDRHQVQLHGLPSDRRRPEIPC